MAVLVRNLGTQNRNFTAIVRGAKLVLRRGENDEVPVPNKGRPLDWSLVMDILR